MKEYGILARMYLCALFLWGLGYLAILPPFEGFDENSHYSNIREISTTGKLPVYGTTMLDSLVTTYAQNGPMPYGTLNPPFDTGMTYSKFFQKPELIANYLQVYRNTPVPSSYQEGSSISWEAIHAPLYYVLLAPIEKISNGLSLVTQVLLLRLATFLIVIVGVALAMRACGTNKAFTGFLLYPLLFPMFFLEFGRLGNDSLCMLISAVLAILLGRYGNESGYKSSLLIGLVLAVGLLTKAFFIPITAAVLSWMFLAYIVKATDNSARQRHFINIMIIGLTAAVLGGTWYLYNVTHNIPIVAFDEAAKLEAQGGLMEGIRKHFTVYGLLQGLVVNLVTWIWGGSWSLVHIYPALYLPMLALLFLILSACASELRKKPLADPLWLGVFLLGFFGAGFLRHIIISLAINGTGSTPSNYLHILLPWVAPMLTIGIAAATKHRIGNITLKLLAIYAIYFQFTIIWSQVALFAGCATKGNDKNYHFPDGSYCFGKLEMITDNLSIIAWPYLALVSYACGIICFGLILKNMRKLREQEN